jgi:hypothetical protein
MAVSGQLSAGGIVPGTHWIGGWVGPEPVWKLWSREKSLAPTGNWTLAFQPLACRYTDWAVPAPLLVYVYYYLHLTVDPAEQFGLGVTL